MSFVCSVDEARGTGPDLSNGLSPPSPSSPRLQSTKRAASASRRPLNSPDWTRTSNLAVNSRPLYQLSYRGMSLADGEDSESAVAVN